MYTGNAGDLQRLADALATTAEKTHADQYSIDVVDGEVVISQHYRLEAAADGSEATDGDIAESIGFVENGGDR